MEGLNLKRMVISLILAAVFGAFCAYGTSAVEIPGFEVTMPYLMTIFYARVLMGVLIGFTGNLKLVESKMKNAALRGAKMGIIATIVISFYGGWEIFILSGIVYGIITDVVATKLSS